MPALSGSADGIPTQAHLREVLDLADWLGFLALATLGDLGPTSFTFSSTMVQCLSKAFMRPRCFLLLQGWMSTWVLFLTDCTTGVKRLLLRLLQLLWSHLTLGQVEEAHGGSGSAL